MNFFRMNQSKPLCNNFKTPPLTKHRRRSVVVDRLKPRLSADATSFFFSKFFTHTTTYIVTYIDLTLNHLLCAYEVFKYHGEVNTINKIFTWNDFFNDDPSSLHLDFFGFIGIELMLSFFFCTFFRYFLLHLIYYMNFSDGG